MEITITLREAIDLGVWDEFCKIKWINPWCINEGIATGCEKYDLSDEECNELGIYTGGGGCNSPLTRTTIQL